MLPPVIVPSLDHAAALSDPRQHAKVLYPSSEILRLVLSATLAGADGFVKATLWGTEHLMLLKRFYRYEYGTVQPRFAVRPIRGPGPGAVQSLLPGLDQRPARR